MLDLKLQLKETKNVKEALKENRGNSVIKPIASILTLEEATLSRHKNFFSVQMELILVAREGIGFLIETSFRKSSGLKSNNFVHN